MNPLWWILIGIGGLIGLVLLLLAAILFTRTAVMVRYNEEGIRFRIRVIGIPITLYPRKEKDKKKKPKKEKKKKPKKQNPKKEGKPSITEDLKHSLKEAKVSDYIKILRIILSDFVGKFGFERLILHISVGGDDAMKIAMTYGRLNAALYPVLGALAAADKLDKCDVQITPDFTSEEFRAEGDAVFSVRLYNGLACILKLVQKL